MTHPLFIVDAFADEPFRGNPAAVCLLGHPEEPTWMQRIAAEMNLSETAFVTQRHDRLRLNWFTPTQEVDLCGHATLAAAHVLWEFGRISGDHPIGFETKSGRLTCTLRREWIRMDFPAEPPTPLEDPAPLLAALNLKTPVPPAAPPKRNRLDYLIELPDEQTLRDFQPNFDALAKLPCRGIIITARSSNPRYDFVSRFFAPTAGINEDPVTGSSHCCLGPYWACILKKKELTAYQASPRGGAIKIQVNGPRILLSGQACTTLRGNLTI